MPKKFLRRTPSGSVSGLRPLVLAEVTFGIAAVAEAELTAEAHHRDIIRIRFQLGNTLLDHTVYGYASAEKMANRQFASIAFSLCFVVQINRKAAYITQLKQELDILSRGQVEYPVTITGADELGDDIYAPENKGMNVETNFSHGAARGRGDLELPQRALDNLYSNLRILFFQINESVSGICVAVWCEMCYHLSKRMSGGSYG